MNFLENDIDTISGLGGINGVLGDLASLDARHPAKRKVKRTLKAKSSIISTTSVSDKAEFEKRLHQLPADIQAGIRSGKLQIVDDFLYSVKAVGGLSYRELMDNADVKTVGLTNVNNRKLEANRWFLLTKIQLMSGVNASPIATDFGIPVAGLLNGDFKFTVGSTVLVPEVSCSIFDTNGRNDLPKGMWVDFIPQWISPQTEIKPEIKLPAALAADTNVKLILHGVTIEKN